MKRGSFRNKRGVSPVIASVLLILLVIVLASLIFLWARGFISEQVEKFGEPIEEYCKNVDFRIERVEGSGFDSFEVVNSGNVDIYNLQIKKILGGNSEVSTFKFSIDSKSSFVGNFDLNMNDTSEPEKVIVTPTLIGNTVGKDSNSVFTCLSQSRELNI